MKARQTIPRQWLVADTRTGDPLAAARRLPRGSGILFLYRYLPERDRARLLREVRRIARARRLTVVDELARRSARVHDMRELRRAGSAGTRLIFLSPIFATQSHPERVPLPRMRAATLARLSKVPVIALGGMTSGRFAQVALLGFQGWAGIGAWKIRT